MNNNKNTENNVYLLKLTQYFLHCVKQLFFFLMNLFNSQKLRDFSLCLFDVDRELNTITMEKVEKKK